MNRLISYIKSAFNEVIYNVTWTSFNSLQESTVLVIIGTAIFGLLIFAMDIAFDFGSETIYKP